MAFGSFDSERRTQAVSEINMVPLIDVMLVLLVIFIITAPLLSHSIRINLPQASSQPVEKEPRVVDLAIDEFGAIYWNEEPVTMEVLTQRFRSESQELEQASVRIRADQDTRYETLAQVMSNARRQGIKRLGFITRPGAPSADTIDAGAPATPSGSAPPATAPDAGQPGAQSLQSPDARTAR